MNEEITPSEQDEIYKKAEKRVRKIKKFYKNLASWAGMSIILIAINVYTTGFITWAKFPVFFWGLAVFIQMIHTIRLYRLDRQWEEKMIRKFTGRPTSLPQDITSQSPDYSDELLRNEQVREKEVADLTEFRKVKRPWKDEDLV